MGTLSERDRRTISQAVKGVARNDPEACLEAVLKLGVVSGDVDRRQLYKDCETMLDRYGSIDLGTMDLSQVVTDIMEIMKKNHIGNARRFIHAGARTCHRGRRGGGRCAGH